VVESNKEQIDAPGAEDVKGFRAFLFVMLLFICGAAFAGEEGGSYSASHGPASLRDPGQEKGGADAVNPKVQGESAGPEARPEAGRVPEASESVYRDPRPNNPVDSRWRIEGGGFVEMGAGRHQ